MLKDKIIQISHDKDGNLFALTESGIIKAYVEDIDKEAYTWADMPLPF